MALVLVLARTAHEEASTIFSIANSQISSKIIVRCNPNVIRMFSSDKVDALLFDGDSISFNEYDKDIQDILLHLRKDLISEAKISIPIQLLP